MITIYKYPVEPMGEQWVRIPEHSKILSAGLDPGGQLCIWALVDTASQMTKRIIYVVGTGNPWHVMAFGLTFVGSVKDGPFMWHVFA